ncbi:hybrid sensor histidine kinase/response regulator [Undibacterium sp. Ji22W]|uniref:hybrid sensor histidine kinase/response regulator n=1 Tax=Undibacterium sp. Ji22W TaxID=3413038 RepID=UPI003BF0A9D3
MDPRTALILTTAFALLNGAILGLMHRGLSRQIRPAATDWRIGTLLAAGGVLLLAAQSPDSVWLLLPVGNTSIFLGFTLYWRSIRRFDHLPDTPWIFLPAAIGAFALTWFTVVAPLLWVRVCIAALVWNTAMAASSYSLVKHRQSRGAIGRICLAGIFLVLICFMGFRAVYYAMYLRDAQTILSNEHFINVLTPISTSILPVIGTTAFLMMCSERLRAELAARAIELDQKNADLRQAILAREDAERIARHDLKTPLASIAAAPALLRQNAEGSEELLQMIEGAARRALNMVNLSLDLYRMEKGQYQLHAEATNLTAIINTVIDDLRVHATAKHLKFQFIEREQATWVWADTSLCYSCVANLVKNAIEAASDQSVVSLLIEQSEMVKLSIHNDTTVPETLRANFFEKYATLGKEGGTGLGTYSSSLLARVQNGDLAMRTSETEGTTLTLSLPAYRGTLITPSYDQGIVSAEPDQAIIKVQRDGQPCVLMVDDDIYNAKVIHHQLARFGVGVQTALNGKFGWYACLQQRPDLILMDIEMPVMNGIDALGAIRNLQQARQQQPSFIVAFSSDDGIESHRRFLNLGFDHCLSKPASVEELLNLMAITPTIEQQTSDWDQVQIHPNLIVDIEIYLSSRFTLVTDLEKAIIDSNSEKVRSIAHKLSGSFSLYGFSWAAQQCKLIETETETLERKHIQAQELKKHLREVPIIEEHLGEDGDIA